MTRFLLTLTALATTLTWAHSAWAEKPAARQPIAFGPNGASGEKIQGFTRKGQEGIGLFGPAGRVSPRAPQVQQPPVQSARSTLQRSAHRQANSQFFYAQQFGAAGAYIPPVYTSPFISRPQPRLQVPYPSQGFVDVVYDDGTTGRVLMGNPANSFAPAGAFGFGPGAIYGW
jgi:hypothetical protein